MAVKSHLLDTSCITCLLVYIYWRSGGYPFTKISKYRLDYGASATANCIIMEYFAHRQVEPLFRYCLYSVPDHQRLTEAPRRRCSLIHSEPRPESGGLLLRIKVRSTSKKEEKGIWRGRESLGYPQLTYLTSHPPTPKTHQKSEKLHLDISIMA